MTVYGEQCQVSDFFFLSLTAWNSFHCLLSKKADETFHNHMILKGLGHVILGNFV